MTKQIGFLIDLNKCIGCHSCEFSCKNYNQLEDISFRKVIDLKRSGNAFSFLSLACNHCANPQCIRVCSKRCYHKLRNGIVLHEPMDCEGCRSCIGACPFEVPKHNPATKKISKCNLCYNRIREGLPPACVGACVPEALRLIEFDEPCLDYYKKTLPSYPFVLLTNPSVRFLLPKETRCSWIDKTED